MLTKIAFVALLTFAGSALAEGPTCASSGRRKEARGGSKELLHDEMRKRRDREMRNREHRQEIGRRSEIELHEEMREGLRRRVTAKEPQFESVSRILFSVHGLTRQQYGHWVTTWNKQASGSAVVSGTSMGDGDHCLHCWH